MPDKPNIGRGQTADTRNQGRRARKASNKKIKRNLSGPLRPL
jgi:hypothetical protein